MTVPLPRVTNAVLAHLRVAWAPTGDGRAPIGNLDGYAVLDVEPGGYSDGDMDLPERETTIRYRITAVSRDSTGAASVDGAREQAEFILWKLHDRILDRSVPITGTGFVVADREHVSSNGTMRDGAVVNTSNTYDIWCCPA